MKFCDKLSKLRKNNNMSQEQLADKLGVSRQAVSKWESGISFPDMAKIIELCKILNCNMEDLLDDGATGNNKTFETKISINTYLKEVLDFITKTLNMFWSMTTIEKIKCILEMGFIILIMILIWSIVGGIIQSIFSGLLYTLSPKVYTIIYNISSIIYKIFGLITGAILFIHIFKIRYLDYFTTIEDNNAETKTKEKPIEELEQNQENKNERKFIEHKKNKIIIRDPKHSTYNFFTLLAHLVLWGLKFLAILLAIPCVISFIFLAFALTTSIYLIKGGIFFVGTTIILIGCLLVNYIILKIIYNFILDQKHNFKRIFIIFIVGLFIAGLGGGISFTTYLTFNSTTQSNEIQYTTKEETIPYEDNIILNFLYYDVTEIIEDNTQENIIIETTYNKEGNTILEDDVFINSYYYDDKHSNKTIKEYSIYYLMSPNYNFIDELNYLIDKLENKERIDTYYQESRDISEIKIYISKDNLEQIKNNYEDYYA